jgi:hypothetical protein
MLALLGGLLVLAALAATGCATPGQPNAGPPDGGQGQLNTGTNTPPVSTPSPDDTPATDTPEDEPGPTEPPGNGGFPTIILTIPPGVFLPWPSPADCLEHDPSNLTIQHSGSGSNELWKITDGSGTPLAFKRQVDAEAGLALAASYRKHCFIGRSTPLSEPNRHRFIMDYWMDPVAGAAPIPNQDCIPHDPSALTVETITFDGATRYRVRDTSSLIAIFYNQADANDAVKVMKHYNRNCYVGRGYNGEDRLMYITNWFATVN